MTDKKEAPSNLVELNFERCIACWDDAIQNLHKVIEQLGKATASIKELRKWCGIKERKE